MVEKCPTSGLEKFLLVDRQSCDQLKENYRRTKVLTRLFSIFQLFEQNLTVGFEHFKSSPKLATM